MSQSCECEHAAHHDKKQLTPNGNPGHSYGADFSPKHIHAVPTPRGLFAVCTDCKNDCLAEYARPNWSNVKVLDCGDANALRFQVWAAASDPNDTSRVASEFICSTDTREKADAIRNALAWRW